MRKLLCQKQTDCRTGFHQLGIVQLGCEARAGDKAANICSQNRRQNCIFSNICNKNLLGFYE